jgi:rubrerythrin
VNAAQKVLAILESEYCAEDVNALTDIELQALTDRVTSVYWHTVAVRRKRAKAERGEVQMALADYPGATWLESSRYAARYDLGREESAWFCLDCGSRIDGDPSNGCPRCGYGQIEEEIE